ALLSHAALLVLPRAIALLAHAALLLLPRSFLILMLRPIALLLHRALLVAPALLASALLLLLHRAIALFPLALSALAVAARRRRRIGPNRGLAVRLIVALAPRPTRLTALRALAAARLLLHDPHAPAFAASRIDLQCLATHAPGRRDAR